MPNGTLTSSFTISAKTRSFQLDPEGKGMCTFTITNIGKTALEGRVRLTPAGQSPALMEWLTIAEPTEQAYQPNEEHAYSVAIAVPPDAPGGTYLFRAEAYAVANPNDDYVGGPEFSFTVTREGSEPGPRFPWWIAFTGLALVVAIVALVAVFTMGGTKAERTTVPDLVGADVERAQTLLNEARLALGNIERTPTADAAEGVIIGQNPAVGEEVDVHFLVSLQVASKPDAPMATVPTLIGVSLAEARRLITAANLAPGLIGEKNAGSGAPGTVLEQVPAAGAAVGQGSEVSLMVKAAPPPAGPVAPVWEGVLRIRQTWFGDIDGATETTSATRKDADFWFQAQTATQRFITAQNGAAFGFPKEASLAACRDAITTAPVTKIDVAQLTPGQLVAVRTNLGRFAVVSLVRAVGPSPATLELRYQRFPIRTLPVRAIQNVRVREVQPVRPALAPQPETLRLDRKPLR